MVVQIERGGGVGDGVKVGVIVGVWDGTAVADGDGVSVQVAEGVNVADRVGDGSGVGLAGTAVGAAEHAPANRMTIKAGSHIEKLLSVFRAVLPHEKHQGVLLFDGVEECVMIGYFIIDNAQCIIAIFHTALAGCCRPGEMARGTNTGKTGQLELCAGQILVE